VCVCVCLCAFYMFKGIFNGQNLILWLELELDDG